MNINTYISLTLGDILGSSYASNFCDFIKYISNKIMIFFNLFTVFSTLKRPVIHKEYKLEMC